VDGKPRPIVVFSSVPLPSADTREVAGSWLRDAPYDVVSNDLPDEGRLVAILMDGSIPEGQATLAARRIARAAVDQLGPGDLAAVVRSTVFGNNGLSQGFTADRSRLQEAIDSPAMGNTEPPEMTVLGLQSPSPVPGLGFTTKPQCEVILDIARAMRAAPRRRKVLLFVGSAIGIGGQVRLGADIRPCRDEMFRELYLSNVTVQAIDPVGLLTTSVSADYTTHGRVTPNLVRQWSQQNQTRVDNLRVLPDRTGGRAVANTNIPENYVPAIFAESQLYYLLGFEPASRGTDGAFHSIRVRVHRRGVTVHSRNGYLAELQSNSGAAGRPDGSTVGEPPRSALAAALDGAVPLQDLPLSVNSAPFPTPGRRTAAVAIALGATLPPGAGLRRIDVTVAAFDVAGRSVDVRSQTLEVPAQLGRLGNVAEGLLARLDLPPGRYELRVAANDEVRGAIGSVFSFVDVPAFSSRPLVASGPLLHHEHPPSVANNPVADIVPIVPTVARVFSQNEKVSAFLRIYQSSEVQTVSVVARIVDTMNRQVFERLIELSPSRFIARTADIDVSLPINQLVTGKYLLTIDISRGGSSFERNTRFEVSSKP
jgi:VWFA-related protein